MKSDNVSNVLNDDSSQPGTDTVISRERLWRILEEAIPNQCHNIASPSGFGKTTLLRDWIEKKKFTKVWLDIDPSYNDPSVFWKGLTSAFSEAGFDTPTNRAPQDGLETIPGSDSWLKLFGRELSALMVGSDKKIALVFDDTHHLINPAIITGLGMSAVYLPRNICFYMLTRTSVLRGLCPHIMKNRFLRLEAADLALSFEEAQSYAVAVHRELENSDPLFLTSPLFLTQLIKIWRLSEGWPILFFNMANRWLIGPTGTSDLQDLPKLSGADEFIEYNVLSELTDKERELLIRLAPLNGLNPELVNQCLFPEEDPRVFLGCLANQHLMIPHPHSPEFRVLRQPVRRFLKSQNDPYKAGEAIRIFTKAYRWYISHGAFHEAITLCIDNEYFLSAINLIEHRHALLTESNQWLEVATWLDRIPSHMSEQRPLLLLLIAQKAVIDSAPDIAIASLQKAETILSDPTSLDDDPSNSYVTQLREVILTQVQTMCTATQSLFALDGPNLDDPSPVIEETDSSMPAGLQLFVDYQRGMTHLYNNRFDDAKSVLLDVLDRALQTQHGIIFQSIASLGWLHFLLGEFEIWQSKAEWLEAQSWAAGSRQISSQFLRNSILLGRMETGSTDQLNDYKALQPEIFGAYISSEQLFRGILNYAQLRLQEGQLAIAGSFLSEAKLHEHSLPDIVKRNYYSLPALEAELLAKQGKPSEAMRLLEVRGMASEYSSFESQHARLTMADLLYQSGQGNSAISHFREVADWAREYGCKPLLIRALIGKALLQHALMNLEKAQKAFEEALELGRQMDSVMPFKRDYAEIAQLLANVRPSTLHSGYLKKLTCLNESYEESNDSDTTVSLAALSKRELQILELLTMGMSNPEIAEKLNRSLGTIKIHVHNIYDKLGVTNRVTAINRYLKATGSTAN